MQAHWEQLDHAPPDDGSILYMDRFLRPHRSLSRSGLKLLMSVVVLVNLVVATVFVMEGAYPVLPFLGLDVAGLYVAFLLNNRAARAFERVRVAAHTLHVQRQDPKGVADHWVVSPAWVRIQDEPRALRLAVAGRGLKIGAFLSPEERGDVAGALRAALDNARKERWPSG